MTMEESETVVLDEIIESLRKLSEELNELGQVLTEIASDGDGCGQAAGRKRR